MASAAQCCRRNAKRQTPPDRPSGVAIKSALMPLRNLEYTLSKLGVAPS